jgi:hypothetical protein
VCLSVATHTLKIAQKPVAWPVCSKARKRTVVGHLAQRAILVPTAAHVQRTGTACSAVLPAHGAKQSKSIGDGGRPLLRAGGSNPVSDEAVVQPSCIKLGIIAGIVVKQLLELVAHSRWEGVVEILRGCLERR